MIQLLTPAGERREDDRFPLGVTPDELRGIYREMVATRRVDAEATALQRQGELGLWAPSLGQEAAQVASVRAFAAGDMLFPSYREHGVALARGVQPAELLAVFRGASHGGWNPFARRLNTYTIVLAAQLLHAVGYAMGVQRDGAEEVVGVYFGDGSTSQGDASEAMNWAGVVDAPVVFCCQNNQYAISVPVARQSPVPLYRRADGFGFPGIRVDGNDVLAVLAVTRWAVERARAGEGPTLIESFTYRMGPHTTSDDPRRYRDAEEVERWRTLDPIERLQRYLDAERLADESFYAQAEADATELAAAVREACLSLEPSGSFPVFAR
ncbi:thiamine pyrophosphate-dependent dehydrogenase E1 component subunit alpha [Cryptosporangium minutisporangium]|uniref:2-oxoisovalerate dehydrogenase subunit alpha n=1 Tax=Cryptosporangium minutisporangium TaxID=113569 RepID=A0ABP6SY99_9ACTN